MSRLTELMSAADRRCHATLLRELRRQVRASEDAAADQLLDVLRISPESLGDDLLAPSDYERATNEALGVSFEDDYMETDSERKGC